MLLQDGAGLETRADGGAQAALLARCGGYEIEMGCCNGGAVAAIGEELLRVSSASRRI